jgi:hypothetical protein
MPWLSRYAQDVADKLRARQGAEVDAEGDPPQVEP